MTYAQANRILDRTREGWEFSEFVILRALELTGDYDGFQKKELEVTDDKDVAK
jgi:hypothetical protein